MTGLIIFLYGIAAYAVGMSSLFVFAAYLLDLIPGFGINSQPVLAQSSSAGLNIILLLLWGVQHSLMARPSFKKKWTKLIPKAMERSTYVLISGVILWAIMLLWHPMPGTVWNFDSSMVQALILGFYILGWVILVAATFLISHFDLFGLRQVYLNLKGQEPGKLKFVTPMLYKAVRHPIYFGFLIVLWCTPTMTLSHFVLALGFTAYILFAVRLEERDLLAIHGKDFSSYQKEVPMLIPSLGSQLPVNPIESAE